MSEIELRVESALLTDVLPILGEELVDLITNFALWNLDVLLLGTIIRHEGQEAIVGDVELPHTYQYFVYHTLCLAAALAYQLELAT